MSLPCSGTATGTIVSKIFGEDVEVEVEVDYRILTPAQKGRTYGDPYYCYPAEAAEIEIINRPLLRVIEPGNPKREICFYTELGNMSEEDYAAIEKVAQEHVDSE